MKKEDILSLKPGVEIRVHQKIQEGDKMRTQIFEGIVIAVGSGHGVSKTFTVRKVVDGIGVEKIFPVYSPLVSKIDITKQSKVRRAKLYYLRGRIGRKAKLYEEEEKESAPKKAS